METENSQSVEAIRAFIQEKIASGEIDKNASDWKTSLPQFPEEVTYEAGKRFTWHLDTSEGPIEIEFLPEVAPQHVTNFIYLSELEFFDGLLFHRVIPGFMAQGGCPLGSGTGGPGYKFDGETTPDVRHEQGGLLSMANTGQPRSDGCQFFLTFVPTPHLDGKHTIFGRVTEGLETLGKLEEFGSSPSGATSKDVGIVAAQVRVS